MGLDGHHRSYVVEEHLRCYKIGCWSIVYTILEEEPGDFEPGQLNCHLVRLAAVVN